MKTIEEGNKLIAEFMGAKNDISDIYYLPEFGHYFNSYGQTEWSDCFRLNELKYCSSWDWLMPVVEKIEKTYAYVNIKGCAVNISTIVETSAPTKIEAVWHACVEFIEWYNNH